MLGTLAPPAARARSSRSSRRRGRGARPSECRRLERARAAARLQRRLDTRRRGPAAQGAQRDAAMDAGRQSADRLPVRRGPRRAAQADPRPLPAARHAELDADHAQCASRSSRRRAASRCSARATATACGASIPMAVRSLRSRPHDPRPLDRPLGWRHARRRYRRHHPAVVHRVERGRRHPEQRRHAHRRANSPARRRYTLVELAITAPKVLTEGLDDDAAFRAPPRTAVRHRRRPVRARRARRSRR